MFVDRDDNGNLTSACGIRQALEQVEMPDDDPELLAWLAGQANPVPGQVSAGQLIQALADVDLLDAVDAAVAQADAMTQRLWARAAFFPRHDPMVLAIAAVLERTGEQMDDLFRLAATK